MSRPRGRRLLAFVGAALLVGACTSGDDPRPVASSAGPTTTTSDRLGLTTIPPVGSVSSLPPVEDVGAPTDGSTSSASLPSVATAVSPAAWRRIVEGMIRQQHDPDRDGDLEADGMITVRYGEPPGSCQAVGLRTDLLLVFSDVGNCDLTLSGTTDTSASPWGTTGRLLSEFVGQVTGELVVREVSGDGTTAGDRTLGEAAGRLPGLTLLERDDPSTAPAEASVARDAGSVAVAVMAGTGRCMWFRADIADALGGDTDAAVEALSSLRYGIGDADECRGNDGFGADSVEPVVPVT